MAKKKAAGGGMSDAVEHQTKRKETDRKVSKDRGKAAAGVHGEKTEEYTVGAEGVILDGKMYSAGDTVKLPPSQARAHTDRGVRLTAVRQERK